MLKVNTTASIHHSVITFVVMFQILVFKCWLRGCWATALSFSVFNSLCFLVTVYLSGIQRCNYVIRVKAYQTENERREWKKFLLFFSSFFLSFFFPSPSHLIHFSHNHFLFCLKCSLSGSYYLECVCVPFW